MHNTFLAISLVGGMLTALKLASAYLIFALIATAANIGAQDVVIRLHDGAFGLWLSIVTGTGVGLIIKYILDKRYIFRFHPHNALHDSHVFLRYTLMGLLTTLVFWGFEFAFHHFFATREMRYLGAVIGLSIGYLMKYRLDKRYVFCSDPVR
jgi:putative flippase GtrA